MSESVVPTPSEKPKCGYELCDGPHKYMTTPPGRFTQYADCPGPVIATAKAFCSCFIMEDEPPAKDCPVHNGPVIATEPETPASEPWGQDCPGCGSPCPLCPAYIDVNGNCTHGLCFNCTNPNFEIHYPQTPYHAANLLAAVMAYPDTGDWHGEARAWLTPIAGDYEPNKIYVSDPTPELRERLETIAGYHDPHDSEGTQWCRACGTCFPCVTRVELDAVLDEVGEPK